MLLSPPRPHRHSPEFILEAVSLAHSLGKGGGNKAARQLGLDRTVLYRWMRAVKRATQTVAQRLDELPSEAERQKLKLALEIIAEAKRWQERTGRSMYACVLGAAQQRGLSRKEALQIESQRALGQYPGG